MWLLLHMKWMLRVGRWGTQPDILAAAADDLYDVDDLYGVEDASHHDDDDTHYDDDSANKTNSF